MIRVLLDDYFCMKMIPKMLFMALIAMLLD
jgi:hypothetical protein